MSSNTNNAAAGQKEDYLDKGTHVTSKYSIQLLTTVGLDTAEKKYGGSLGQDTQKNRGVNEKVVSVQPHQYREDHLLTT